MTTAALSVLAQLAALGGPIASFWDTVELLLAILGAAVLGVTVAVVLWALLIESQHGRSRR